MDGTEVYQGLLDRGWQPVQAAALAGNILQESGGNPDALNEKEGARGLLQWRQDRLDGLQAFAKTNGTAPNDPNTQLDFIRQEMSGPEAKSSAPFLSAPDLPSANAALHRYIRYGDNSEGVRLANAQGFLGQRGAPAGPAPLALGAPPPPAPQAAAAPQQPAAQAPQYSSAPPAAVPNYDQQAPFALFPQRPRIDLAAIYANMKRG